MSQISVLVVDDSAFMRKAICRMLESDPLLNVVGQARDGFEAVHKASTLKPDVITLDVRMPEMDGLQALEQIMSNSPTPVLMISSLTSEGGEATLKALEMGAVDFIDKSACDTMMDILEIKDALIQKIKIIANVNLHTITESRHSRVPWNPLLITESTIPSHDNIPSQITAIGTSTGGPVSLETILSSIPKKHPGAITVVQHMPLGFTESLADRLNRMCPLKVKEAQDGEPVLPGTVYIGKSGLDFTFHSIDDKMIISLVAGKGHSPHCPSVDVMMESIAKTWNGPLLGIIMTGMGQDGTLGIKYIKERGGTVLAQDEATSIVYGMPRSAVLSGNVDRSIPLNQIADEITRFR